MTFTLTNLKYSRYGLEVRYQHKFADHISIAKFNMSYVYTINRNTNEYKICKELIDTENKTLAFLNINNLNLGIRLIARKILDI